MEKTLLTAPLSLTEIAPELPTFTDKFKGARRCNATRGPFAIECCDANFRYAKLIWIKRDPNIFAHPPNSSTKWKMEVQEVSGLCVRSTVALCAGPIAISHEHTSFQDPAGPALSFT